MVTHTGAPVRADRLRPLSPPRPIRVQADERGYPLAVGGRGRSFIAVQEVVDRWRIDDEWWRKEISRMYFHVTLAGGRVLTIFQYLIAGNWFMQTTATRRPEAEPLVVLAPRASSAA